MIKMEEKIALAKKVGATTWAAQEDIKLQMAQEIAEMSGLKFKAITYNI